MRVPHASRDDDGGRPKKQQVNHSPDAWGTSIDKIRDMVSDGIHVHKKLEKENEELHAALANLKKEAAQAKSRRDGSADQSHELCLQKDEEIAQLLKQLDEASSEKTDLVDRLKISENEIKHLKREIYLLRNECERNRREDRHVDTAPLSSMDEDGITDYDALLRQLNKSRNKTMKWIPEEYVFSFTANGTDECYFEEAINLYQDAPHHFVDTKLHLFMKYRHMAKNFEDAESLEQRARKGINKFIKKFTKK
jgi:acetolactate synthase small subunit